jgi:hypothetical protein
MFNQHAKWSKVSRTLVAPAHRFSELPPHLTRLASGP